jgi:hypothetical protein
MLHKLAFAALPQQPLQLYAAAAPANLAELTNEELLSCVCVTHTQMDLWRRVTPRHN